MRKVTEEDLGFGKEINEEYKNELSVDKIVLNQTISDLNKGKTAESSKEDSLSSSNICNGICSSSSSPSEIVGNIFERVTPDLKDDSLISVSQHNESSVLKQDEKQLAVNGVSVALVTITEKIIDLPESKIILNLLQARLKQENIEMSQKNLMLILKITMELIEKSPLKGLSQKEVAIQILNKLFMEANLDNESIDVICSFLDTNLIGDTIDLIVAASKGEFDINKATKVATGCFTRIFGCFTVCFKKLKCNNRQKNKNIELKSIKHEIEKELEKDVETVVNKRLEQIIDNEKNKDPELIESSTPLPNKNTIVLNEILT